MSELNISITNEREADALAVDGLEERAFGPGRFSRTAFRLREGNPHDKALSFVARVSTLVVGSIRLTGIRIGEQRALLLGPLTVDPAFHSKGIGRRLVEASLAAAIAKGHRLVILVGDEAYYGRMGFKRVPQGKIIMPGPVDPTRILVRELADGAMGTLEHPAFCQNRGSHSCANQIHCADRMEVGADDKTVFDGFAGAGDGSSCCG
jgi:predicted N-acetyltransferase YhbS